MTYNLIHYSCHCVCAILLDDAACLLFWYYAYFYAGGADLLLDIADARLCFIRHCNAS